MPNSGTVTAGSVALASQYNNLRSDVLDASTGHTHSGAADSGAKIEGTAIKSTGATNGQVLTADGSGNTTFAAVQGAGALSAFSGSAIFGTATSGTAFQYVGPGYSNPHVVTPMDLGSKFVAITSSDWVAASANGSVTVYTLGSATPVSSAVAETNAVGTVAFSPAFTNGFGAGTTFIIRETAATADTVYYTLRKFNADLTSNVWSSSLISFTAKQFNSPQTSVSVGPGGGQPRGWKYISSIDAWIGGDTRSGQYGNLGDEGHRARIWLVNDTSGSVYSATFGSVTGGTTSAFGVSTSAIVYVPGDGTALGTVHAFGTTTENGAQWAKYTVGSASITAASTVTGGSVNLFGQFTPETIPLQAYYDAATTAVYLFSASRVWKLNKAMTEVQFSSDVKLFSSIQTGIHTTFNDGYVHATDGYSATNNNAVTRIGSFSNDSFAAFGTPFSVATGTVAFAGAGGSVTSIVAVAGTGVIRSWSVTAGFGTVAIGSAATGRILTLQKDGVFSIKFGSGFYLGAQSTVDPISFVLPAGATASIVIRNNMTPTNGYVNMGTAFTIGTASQNWLTTASTGVVRGNVIALS